MYDRDRMILDTIEAMGRDARDRIFRAVFEAEPVDKVALEIAVDDLTEVIAACDAFDAMLRGEKYDPTFIPRPRNG
jgi:hypothetical protein